ncbi:MAG: hypothetical protein ABIP17_12005 [Ilumatobacteraceae bacterium]
MAEYVEIDLPLSAKYALTVRAVAASVAAEIGLSIQEIDDLRLGVNEAISVLTDVDDDELDSSAARLTVRFEANGDRIGVAASRSGIGSADLQIDMLAEKILGAVVDEFTIDDSGVFRLVKLRSSHDDT